MKTKILTALTVVALAGPAFAAGDAGAGKKDFNKCKACHSIVAPDNKVIVRGGKIGPNLWGVVGRTAGTEEGYTKYSEEMVALGEEDFKWTPEHLAGYIPNAKKFLSDKAGKPVRTTMTPQHLKDVNDVIAFLAQYGPDASN